MVTACILLESLRMSQKNAILRHDAMQCNNHTRPEHILRDVKFALAWLGILSL